MKLGFIKDDRRQATVRPCLDLHCAGLREMGIGYEVYISGNNSQFMAKGEVDSGTMILGVEDHIYE